jgi:hypothetical protein
MNYVGLAFVLAFSFWWILFPASVVAFYQRIANRKILAPPLYQLRLAGALLAATAIVITFR